MKYHISPCVYGGYRIWVQLRMEEGGWYSMSDFVRYALDRLSKWGGADKEGNGWRCWEFDSEMLPAYERIMKGAGYQQDNSVAPEWIKTWTP